MSYNDQMPAADSRPGSEWKTEHELWPHSVFAIRGSWHVRQGQTGADSHCFDGALGNLPAKEAHEVYEMGRLLNDGPPTNASVPPIPLFDGAVSACVPAAGLGGDNIIPIRHCWRYKGCFSVSSKHQSLEKVLTWP